MTEICNNGVDDDGDGLVDCADPDCNADPITTDVDKDGDVDLGDYTVFQQCFTTAGNPWPGPPDVEELCLCLDRDQDLDVDLTDYATFEQCLNGPDQPPGC